MSLATLQVFWVNVKFRLLIRGLFAPTGIAVLFTCLFNGLSFRVERSLLKA